MGSGLWSTGTESQARTQTSGKKEKKKTGDDPYYFGLSARIPNFVKSRKKKQKERNRANPGQIPLTRTILTFMGDSRSSTEPFESFQQSHFFSANGNKRSLQKHGVIKQQRSSKLL